MSSSTLAQRWWVPCSSADVQGELDRVRAVAHHDAHERAVLGGDVLVVERDEGVEAKHLHVVVDHGVHLVPADVADDVVDPAEPARDGRDRLPGLEAREEGAGVVVPPDEAVQRVAIGVDGGTPHPARRRPSGGTRRGRAA